MTAKKRKVRNRARDVIGDYYKTNTQYTRENRERQKEQEKKGIEKLESYGKAVSNCHYTGADRYFLSICRFLKGGSDEQGG